jgi:hypothetical protein
MSTGGRVATGRESSTGTATPSVPPTTSQPYFDVVCHFKAGYFTLTHNRRLRSFAILCRFG